MNQSCLKLYKQLTSFFNNQIMKELIWETPEETIKALAGRVKILRKRKKITQLQLSTRSGVSYGSIKRFEETGQISLLSLTKLAAALEVSEEIRTLFSDVPYKSIDEVIREQR